MHIHTIEHAGCTNVDTHIPHLSSITNKNRADKSSHFCQALLSDEIMLHDVYETNFFLPLIGTPI